MKTWPDRLRLFAVLTATRTLVAKSEREGWPDESPEQIGRDLDQIIDAIFFKKNGPLPRYWSILFAPTGPIQEISISNGWAEPFLKLAEEVDSCEYILKAYEAEQAAASGGGSATALHNPRPSGGPPSVN